jgi:hypothetical protein
MDAQLLINYLAQRINAAMLSHTSLPSGLTGSDEFELFPRHLLQLCDAVLSGDIDPGQLQPISYCLYYSGSFRWQQQHPDGRVVEEILTCWLAFDENRVPTHGDIRYCREWLMYGRPPDTVRAG